ncbi:hypothetical protein L837_3643 [Mycobacterium avium MAV_061107_1842]|nr:hypothetical protein L837_3643 [Mycobacterium avium MAV_061107_1842]
MHRLPHAEYRRDPAHRTADSEARRGKAGETRSDDIAAQRVRRLYRSGRECGRHFPVTERRASTICAGVGGQPATSTSTGTISPTAPTTPYASVNTPRLRAQSPQAITTRG